MSQLEQEISPKDSGLVGALFNRDNLHNIAVLVKGRIFAATGSHMIARQLIADLSSSTNEDCSVIAFKGLVQGGAKSIKPILDALSQKDVNTDVIRAAGNIFSETESGLVKARLDYLAENGEEYQRSAAQYALSDAQKVIDYKRTQ